MAKGRTEKREARQSAEEDQRARMYLKENPAGRDFKSPVEADLARYKGRSESRLQADADRGAASPLGYGTGATQPVRKGRKR